MARYNVATYLEDGSTVLEEVRGEKYPNGKDYTFASPSAKVGLRLMHLFELGVKSRAGIAMDASDSEALLLDDGEERNLMRQVMGATLDELVADAVPITSVNAIFGLLFRHHGAGADIGELISEGKARKPSRPSTRRTPRKKVGSDSVPASTGTPARTRKPASTRSSTSPNAREAQTA